MNKIIKNKINKSKSINLIHYFNAQSAFGKKLNHPGAHDELYVHSSFAASVLPPFSPFQFPLYLLLRFKYLNLKIMLRGDFGALVERVARRALRCLYTSDLCAFSFLIFFSFLFFNSFFQLALKHRINKTQRQRILLFVGSPVVSSTSSFSFFEFAN